MLTLTVVGLGLLAGLTIFVGMPVARRRSTPARVRTFLSAFAAGILLFLFWDIMSGALAPVLTDVSAGGLSAGTGLLLLVVGGFALSYGGLVIFERIYRVRVSATDPDTGAGSAEAPPALSPLRAMDLIAVGIGLHNLAEGLAIGSAYLQGLQLSLVLVIGFAIHNATEGFGIVGPALASNVVPSWRRIGALGLVAGGPTLIGTILGNQAGNIPFVSTAFLAIAAGAILYVVLELVQVRGRAPSPFPKALGVYGGFVVGLVTDLVITAAHV